MERKHCGKTESQWRDPWIKEMKKEEEKQRTGI